jgi:peptidoglycan/xylan/chitin deacetylase (PgdA/CDA1 family)
MALFRTSLQYLILKIMSSKIALSFDVEDWYHAPAITGSSFSLYKTIDDFFTDWKMEYDCLSDGFFYLLNLLEKNKIRATFFLVADVIDRYPEIAVALKKSGHEVACHSLHHVCAINATTKKLLKPIDEWEKDLVEAKNKIESFFGKKIIGYRAPGAYVGKWMVKLLERNGFRYDSSVACNSFYNKTDVYLKNIPSYPYYIHPENLSAEKSDSKLVELPWSYWKAGGITFPAGGAFFFRLLGTSYFNLVMQQCLKKGDTMFYIHPLDFSNIRIPATNNRSRPMYWLRKGNATRKMFEKFLIRSEEKFTTCEEVYSRFIQSEK